MFSSTCATYGEPETVPMREDDPADAGQRLRRLQARVDRMIGDECRAHGLAAASLRYFNVAGARGELGEDHEPETHLIPLVLQAAAGARDHVKVFGTDYPTRDGTAVRDYIHVEDLGDAHLLALDAAEPGRHRDLQPRHGRRLHGHARSIDAARRVTGPRDPRARGAAPPRRPAGAGGRQRPHPRASSAGSRGKGLDEMIADAWAWHQAHPDGYGD